MFCPNCGLEGQQAGGYCRRCGAVQPDQSTGIGPRRLSRMTRPQKIARMRLLGVISGAMSLVSAIIIVTILAQAPGAYRFEMSIAALLSVLVTIYQVIMFSLGRKIFNPQIEAAHTTAPPVLNERTTNVLDLPPADTAEFAVPSVTEETTRHLDPVERKR